MANHTSWYRKLGYEGPSKISSYLKKRKSDKKIGFFSKYNKRWFVMDFDKGTLTYANGPSKKVACTILFKDILRVNSDIDRDKLRVTTNACELKMLQNQIVLYTVKRVYYLYSFEGNSKALWTTALKFVVTSRDGTSSKKKPKGQREVFSESRNLDSMENGRPRRKPRGTRYSEKYTTTAVLSNKRVEPENPGLFTQASRAGFEGEEVKRFY